MNLGSVQTLHEDLAKIPYLAPTYTLQREHVMILCLELLQTLNSDPVKTAH